MTAYDAIIAGASFAGLAAAQRLRGRVLLVDREPIGAGVTSACAAPLWIVRMMGAEDAVQEVHDRLVLHTPGRSATWRLPEPFCTFDYARFCALAFARTGAEFRRAAVDGFRGTAVLVGEEVLPARAVVDATGWRGAPAFAGDRPVRAGGPRLSGRRAVGRSLRLAPGRVAHSRGGHEQGSDRSAVPHGPGAAAYGAIPRSAPASGGRPSVRRALMRLAAFGVESEVPADVGPGLHFYFLPEVRDGYAWAFPCGKSVRFGVLSYTGRTRLTAGLTAFMARFGLRPAAMHGGYLTTGFRDPVRGGVFVVGDAAGQCLPLTGEGIRTAVLAGYRAGDLLQDVLDDRRPFDEAAALYRAFVAAGRRAYRALLWGNLALLAMPLPLTAAAATWLSRPRPLGVFMRRYLGIFAAPPPAAGGRPAAR